MLGQVIGINGNVRQVIREHRAGDILLIKSTQYR